MKIPKPVKILLKIIAGLGFLYVAFVAVMVVTQETPPDKGLLKIPGEGLNESEKSYYRIIHRSGSKLYVAKLGKRLRDGDIAQQGFFIVDLSDDNAPVPAYNMGFFCSESKYKSLDDPSDNGSVVSGSPLAAVMYYACWQPPLERLKRMF